MRATRGAANRSPPGSGFAVDDRVARAGASQAGARLRPGGSRHPRPGSRAGAAVPRSQEPPQRPGQKWVSSLLAAPRFPSLESQPGCFNSDHRSPEPAPSAGRRGDTQDGFLTLSTPPTILTLELPPHEGLIPQLRAASALASVASVSTFEADRMGVATETSSGVGATTPFLSTQN